MNTRQNRKPKPFAGIYLRAGARTWFWGWGTPPAQTRESAGVPVAEWLRRIRAQTAGLGEENASSRDSSDRSQPATSAAVPVARVKRRLRFVCDRNVIGLVFR
jgi:hypothetical protein